MPQEVELKLSVAPEHASHLWQVLAHHRHDKPVTQQLFSAYYDTPNSRLKAGGAALRLRREGRRWIQTVKHSGGVTAGLHQRAEHETEVAAQLLNFPALVEAGIGDLIAQKETRDAISVVFVTEFSRTSTLLRFGSEALIEVCLDRGAIVAGDRRDPICEIELELKSGTAQALFDLALEIARKLPLRLDNRSKAERGYRLLAGTKPAPAKAAPADFAPDMSLHAAFAVLAFQCLTHLQANESGLLEARDHEYLHQARVALRRLRSVFRIFDPVVPRSGYAAVSGELKSLGRTLGAARDWDVFVTETATRAVEQGGAHPGIAMLRTKTQTERRQAGRLARAAVAAPAYTDLLIRLAAMLHAQGGATAANATTTLREFVVHVLTRQYAKVLKRGRRLDRLAFADLHRLRIEIKRLRYASEFFAPLAPKKARDYPDVLAELQDLLGRLNDNATAWRLLDQLAVANPSADYQQAVGFLRGMSAADAEQCRQRLADAWAQFERVKPWW